MARLTGGSGDAELSTAKLCAFATLVTGVTGTGVSLMQDGIPRGAAHSTDAVSAGIEELQFMLGEGPCLDAFRGNCAVAEPDLRSPDSQRWTGFSAGALGLGVRAIFGFPLHVGPVILGALDLYRDQPGPLSAGQHADALVLADLVAETLLALQAGARSGELAADLEASDFHSAVHQASGMVAVQLDVSIDVALVRLRAHAFAQGRPLTSVAADVVARRLRLD